MSMFTMEDVRSIEKIALSTAKLTVIAIIDKSSANRKNKSLAKIMVVKSRSITNLMMGMTGYILAHPTENLKVIG